MRYHYQAAVKAGATDEEIAEMVAVTMTVSAGKRKAIINEIVTEQQE